MAYLKPQTPLKDLNSGDYFYPLTTIDQVQKSDGSRVQDYDLGNVALEDSETAPGPGTPQMTTLMNMVYPIGSIYMSVNATSPASLFGGTWEQIQDRFLLAAGSTYSAGSTGGSATHTHTIAHTHTMAHTHDISHTHTMAHTHSQVATTSGGPSNNTSGGPSNNTSAGPSNNTSGGPSNNTSGSTVLHMNNLPVETVVRTNNGANGSASTANWTAAPAAGTWSSHRLNDGRNTSWEQGHTHTLSSHTHGLSSHTHALQSHTHSLQSHTHTTAATTTGGASNATTSAASTSTSGGASNATTSAASNANSGSASTLPPYLAVYIWKRTA